MAVELAIELAIELVIQFGVVKERNTDSESDAAYRIFLILDIQ